MKKISQHLGEIIVALAGVALLVTAIVFFKAPIGDFFANIINKETNIGNQVLEGMSFEAFGDLQVKPIYDGSVDGFTANYYMSETGPVEGKNVAYTSKILVNPGETLYITFDNERIANEGSLFRNTFCYAEGAFLCFDENDNYIKTLSRTDIKDVNDSGDITIKSITVPENTAYLIANIRTSIAIEEPVASYLRIYRNPITINSVYNSVLSENNNLTGKNVLIIGDSITHGKYSEGISFIDYIAATNKMNYLVCATGGHTAANMYNRLTTISTTYKSTFISNENSYLIFAGFVNDSSVNTPLGELTAVGTTEFDDTTYIGCLEKMFYELTNNDEYKAKLGVVLTSKPYGANAYRDKPEYWDAAISVLEKYNIPYLNLYSENIDCIDGVHPSQDGQLKMARLIEAWMNTLH